MKTAYICGPLTNLPAKDQLTIKSFYSKIADACQQATGLRGFAPHEHYDPVKFAHFTPRELDDAERNQVYNKTSIVIAMYLAPSWGGGIEVEMARQSGVPVIIVCPKGKKISRLLLGNESVRKVIYYEGEIQALALIKETIAEILEIMYWCPLG